MNKVVILRNDGTTVIAKTKGSPCLKVSQVSYWFLFTHFGPRAFKKENETKYIHDLVGASMYTVPIDGRTKEAKSLPWYSVRMLIPKKVEKKISIIEKNLLPL